jgi:hypothetical protein
MHLTELQQLKLEGEGSHSFGLATLRSMLASQRCARPHPSILLRYTPLQELSFSGCFHLQDAGLEVVTALSQSLTVLSLASCRALTGKGFASIAKLFMMQKLDISECAFTSC